MNTASRAFRESGSSEVGSDVDNITSGSEEANFYTNSTEKSVVAWIGNGETAVVNGTIPGYVGEKVRVQPKELLNRTVIAWEGVKDMFPFMRKYWSGNLFCETIDKARKDAFDALLPITMNISFGCEELFISGIAGTGNYISALYGIRLAAQVYGNIDIHVKCSDAEATKRDLVLPWLTGWFKPRTKGSPFDSKISIQQACGNLHTIPMSYMYREIQHDFRRMAIGLVGVLGPDHPSAQFAEDYLWSDGIGDDRELTSIFQLPTPRRDDEPVFLPGTIEFDDTVIHFRCGDLLTINHPGYFFLKFSGYAKLISPEVRTIGISTQPFDSDAQNRKTDSHNNSRAQCRIIVMSFVDYIQERFPSATIRIHNGRNETISLAYARMIMANQTIAATSSFGVFPVTAAFGTGYILLPAHRGAPNKWLMNPRIDTLTNNVVLFEEPKRIKSGKINTIWRDSGERAALEWFWNDSVTIL